MKTLLDLPETNFQGYDKSELNTNIDLIIQNNNIVNSLSKGEKPKLFVMKQFFMQNSVVKYQIMDIFFQTNLEQKSIIQKN